MKKAAMLCVLALFTSGATVLAEDGIPSQSKLSRLGLGAMQIASDAQGREVRGKAYAIAGGRMTVSNSGANSFFGPFYFAGNQALLTGSADSGAPFAPGFGPAAATVGTFSPVGNLFEPIVLENIVTVNGQTWFSGAYAQGNIFAAGL